VDEGSEHVPSGDGTQENSRASQGAAFIDAARAAEMLVMKEEYIQVRGEKRTRKTKDRGQPSAN
jgi:hypothetical protein